MCIYTCLHICIYASDERLRSNHKSIHSPIHQMCFRAYSPAASYDSGNIAIKMTVKGSTIKGLLSNGGRGKINMCVYLK